MRDHSLPDWAASLRDWEMAPDGPRRKEPVLGELSFEFEREDILARVKENRDKHAAEHKEALEGYYIEVEESLLDIAKRAKAQAKLALAQQDPQETHFGVRASKPENHTADYDRIIDMLELAKDDKIELDEGEFSRYVRDEWVWKAAFTETANHYSNVKLSKSGR